jgi:hypothetical protein
MYHVVTQTAEIESSNQGERGRGEDEQVSSPSKEGPSSEQGGGAGEQDERANRKERVLHTRVPAVLERELKRFADNLRVPVSNLVRTILEDALNVADAATENVEERLKKAAHQLEVERERFKKRVMVDPLADVFAFQTVTLAQPATCVKCEREMKPGERAHLGLSDGPPKPGRRIFACDDCLPK